MIAKGNLPFRMVEKEDPNLYEDIIYLYKIFSRKSIIHLMEEKYRFLLYSTTFRSKLFILN